jgi:hypothetical protein
MPQPSGQEERELWTELYLKHFETWSEGGKFEEIPAEIRDAGAWAHAETYGPVFLGLVWHGVIEGREELLATGVDFGLAQECSDIVGGRLHPPPNPNTPRKLH